MKDKNESKNILLHIKDDFKLDATQLLEHANSPSRRFHFSFDDNGIVTINGTTYPGNKNLINKSKLTVRQYILLHLNTYVVN